MFIFVNDVAILLLLAKAVKTHKVYLKLIKKTWPLL